MSSWTGLVAAAARGEGCDECAAPGYRGRLGVHEFMGVDAALRPLIQSRQTAEKLRVQAVASGMRTLRQDGIEKVLAGVTTIGGVRASNAQLPTPRAWCAVAVGLWPPPLKPAATPWR